jgi:hypothetical protein
VLLWQAASAHIATRIIINSRSRDISQYPRQAVNQTTPAKRPAATTRATNVSLANVSSPGILSKWFIIPRASITSEAYHRRLRNNVTDPTWFRRIWPLARMPSLLALARCSGSAGPPRLQTAGYRAGEAEPDVRAKGVELLEHVAALAVPERNPDVRDE